MLSPASLIVHWQQHASHPAGTGRDSTGDNWSKAGSQSSMASNNLPLGYSFVFLLACFFFLFFFWAFGFGLGFVLGLFFCFCFPHEHSMKESLIYYKNENCTTVQRWRSVQLFLQKGDISSHTHLHTLYIRLNSDEHSVLPSLSRIVPTRQSKKKKNHQHLHSEVVLEQRQKSLSHWMSKCVDDEKSLEA